MACISCILILFHQYQNNLVKHIKMQGHNSKKKKKRHSTIIINLSGKATQTSSLFGFIVII